VQIRSLKPQSTVRSATETQEARIKYTPQLLARFKVRVEQSTAMKLPMYLVTFLKGLIREASGFTAIKGSTLTCLSDAILPLST
jgi:hypothetical protein